MVGILGYADAVCGLRLFERLYARLHGRLGALVFAVLEHFAHRDRQWHRFHWRLRLLLYALRAEREHRQQRAVHRRLRLCLQLLVAGRFLPVVGSAGQCECLHRLFLAALCDQGLQRYVRDRA